ncbi:MAG: GDSL-type esterase/lipase family protein [Bacteroidota bacterium]
MYIVNPWNRSLFFQISIPKQLLIVLLLLVQQVHGQPGSQWDNTSNKDWPTAFKEIEIRSTADDKIQKAFFYASKSDKPQPLVISLHTWSGDYTQKDPLTTQILQKDWNYIHPDFRGPNWTPEACGSSLVVSDIDDAIEYALQNSNVDTTNVHIIGVSGGGYATMLAYMQSKHHINSFSAWSGISDINAWYQETRGRELRYATHISLATTGDSSGIDVESAKSRSPLYMNTPVDLRSDSKLFVYTGVHDGYTGSVPITHSIKFYNKVVADFDPSEAIDLVPEEVSNRLITTRSLPGNKSGMIENRVIHFQKNFENKVYITLFEGTHEMLSDVALDHIPTKTILAIGDSNGQMRGGWVDQLSEIRRSDVVINESISGNTIGFDNNGNLSLNTVRNIEDYLHKHDLSKGRLDKIVILLGTNDCKAVFKDRMDEVPVNYQKILNKIMDYYIGYTVPDIIMVSPPPYGDDEMLIEKYKGAGDRVLALNKKFSSLARKNNIKYLDIYTPLVGVFYSITRDGVHVIPSGQNVIAQMINKVLEE